MAMFAETFRVLDRHLRIRTDDASVAAYLRAVYAPLRAGNRCATDVDEGLISWGERPRVCFNGEDLMLPHEKTAAPFLTGFFGSSCIFQRSFLLNTNYSAWYASAVNVCGNAIAISAPSGVGKTTLTLELLRRGHCYYGDEFVFVRKSDRSVYPFARRMMIREPTLQFFAGEQGLQDLCRAQRPTQGSRYRTWHGIDPSAAFDRNVIAKPAPLRNAFLLERGERSEVHPLSPSVFALSVATRAGHAAEGMDRIWAFLDLLAGVRCYRLTMNDLTVAADRIVEAVACAW